MRSTIFLKTENHLNKVLKKQKKIKYRMSILFTSLWDENSNKLLERIKNRASSQEAYGGKDFEGRTNDGPLYIANSFLMPHSFIIFQTFKVPTLVKLFGDSVRCEDYLPSIYKELNL